MNECFSVCNAIRLQIFTDSSSYANPIKSEDFGLSDQITVPCYSAVKLTGVSVEFNIFNCFCETKLAFVEFLF